MTKRMDDSSLQANLRSALPEYRAPEQFRAELRQRLLDAPEKVAINHRRRQPLAGLIGLAAMLLLTIGYLVWPLFVASQLAALPPLSAVGTETQGASGGPGFTVVLDYQLSVALGSLPKQATVYRYRAPEYTAAAIEQLASRLGLTGQAVQEAWQDSYTLSVGQSDHLLIAFPDGYRNYFRQYPEQTAAFPDDAELIALAESFLPKIGVDRLEVTCLEVKAGDGYTPAAVVFSPQAVSNQLSVSPYISVSVGADRQIYGAAWVWPGERESADSYPTRGVEQAFRDVQAGNGRLVIDYRQLPGPVSGDELRGTARIDNVSVGYVQTYDQNGDIVLQPVAAFSGQASFADGTTLAVTAYSPLVADRYYR